jgi:hypothetical protein
MTGVERFARLCASPIEAGRDLGGEAAAVDLIDAEERAKSRGAPGGFRSLAPGATNRVEQGG